MSQLVRLLPASHDIYHLTGPRGGVWTRLGRARCFQLSLEAAIGGSARASMSSQGWTRRGPPRSRCSLAALGSRRLLDRGPDLPGSWRPGAVLGARRTDDGDTVACSRPDPGGGVTRRRGRRETSRAGRRLQVSSPPTPCPPRPVSDH